MASSFSNFQIFKLYNYLKALHIIFIVTWFAGMFYMPRLFIYATEAGEKGETEKKILRNQFAVMMKRLWYGITWPSAVITLILGLSVLFHGGWYKTLFEPAGTWLLVKLVFVLLLYVYHISLHCIFKQEMSGLYKYSSNQLRIWNEVATVFLEREVEAKERARSAAARQNEQKTNKSDVSSTKDEHTRNIRRRQNIASEIDTEI